MFGAVLRASGIGDALADSLGDLGLPVIVAAYIIAVILRLAQGSATVALVTAAGLAAPAVMAGDFSPLQVVAITLATAAGSVFAGHVNDSGFWLVGRLMGMDVKTTLKTWTGAAGDRVGAGLPRRASRVRHRRAPVTGSERRPVRRLRPPRPRHGVVAGPGPRAGVDAGTRRGAGHRARPRCGRRREQTPPRPRNCPDAPRTRWCSTSPTPPRWRAPWATCSRTSACPTSSSTTPGVQRRAPIHEFAVSDWDDIVAANLSGVFYVSRFVTPAMVARGSGKGRHAPRCESRLARQTIAPTRPQGRRRPADRRHGRRPRRFGIR